VVWFAFRNIAGCNILLQVFFVAGCIRTYFPGAQQWGMTDEPLENKLRLWREYRRMTQEQLAEAIGTTAAVISLLESGKRRLSLKWLLKIAPALRTTPGFILDHDPDDLPTDILDIWADIPEQQQAQALEILKTFARKTG
jgi:transcriptional regulator with XRE-family HTH domain